MEINHLTPFPDPKDLPSLPLLPRRWVGTGGAETVRRRQGRRIKGSRWVIGAAEATPPQSEATPPPSERTASAEPWLILTSQAEKNDLYILLNIQLIACVCVHVCVLALVRGPTGRWCSVRSTCHGAESLIDAWCFSGGGNYRVQMSRPNFWPCGAATCAGVVQKTHFFKGLKMTWTVWLELQRINVQGRKHYMCKFHF